MCNLGNWEFRASRGLRFRLWGIGLIVVSEKTVVGRFIDKLVRYLWDPERKTGEPKRDSKENSSVTNIVLGSCVVRLYGSRP